MRFLVLSLSYCGLAAAQAPEGETEERRYGLTVLLAPNYSSNLYHEQRRREDDFDQNALGERYHDMEGPADIATEVSVEGFYDWKLGKKRDAGLTLGAGYVFHVRNGIANYFSFATSFDYDVGTRDRLSLGVEVIPRRFKKNYSIREIAGERFYDPAYYWQVEGEVGWRHKWTKRLKTALAYQPGIRRYLDPFENRNVTRQGAELAASYDFGRVEPSLGAGAELGSTPSGLEFGVPVDRSYRDFTLLAGVGVSLGHGFSVGAQFEYRNRFYTTDEPANETYFDRTDQRWTFGIDGKKRFGDSLALMAGVGFVRNVTNRQDHPGVDPEDLGYEEVLVGIGVEATL